MVSRTRIFGWLSVSFLALLVFAWAFGTRLFWVYEARHMAKQIPVVNSVPEFTVDTSSRSISNAKIEFGDVELELPWADIDTAKAKAGNNIAELPFRSGKGVVVYVGSPKQWIQDRTSIFQSLRVAVQAVYGDGAVTSDLALKSAIYRTTPREITPLTPNARAAELGAILMTKGIMSPVRSGSIFNLRFEDLQGFQFSDPSQLPKKLSVNLYDSDSEFEFMFSQMGGGSDSQPITQDDLNLIIHTVKKSAHHRDDLQITTNDGNSVVLKRTSQPTTPASIPTATPTGSGS